MKVYRICCVEEVNAILNNQSFEGIGSTHHYNDITNTHSYKNGIAYMHFFQKFDSIFYWTRNYPCPLFICTYDIPFDILKNYLGYGHYKERNDGQNYIEYYKRGRLVPKKSVAEYAIPNTLLNIDYLVKVQKMEDRIKYVDYLSGNYEDRLETIYESKGPKLNRMAGSNN